VCVALAASHWQHSDSVVVAHPDFRMIVLANRPGFPFLGNDFFGAMGMHVHSNISCCDFIMTVLSLNIKVLFCSCCNLTLNSGLCSRVQLTNVIDNIERCTLFLKNSVLDF